MSNLRWNHVIGLLLAGMLAVGLIVAILLARAPGRQAAVMPDVGRQEVTPLAGKANPAPSLSAPEPGKLYVARVYVNDTAEQTRLLSGGWDVLEARGPGYLLVIADAETLASLGKAGFKWSLDSELPPIAPGAADTYFGGYRTVAEHIAHLQAVSNTYPALTTVITYGVSWKRQQNAAEGTDLHAICITRMRPGDCALSPETDKPRFFLMGSIHARELTTAEIVYRFIDELVTKYDVDPDITALLDTAEVWLVPVVNPDGRQIVEQGGSAPYTQRKNANNSGGACSFPPTSGSQIGIDLNRNANWRWGVEGVSFDPCALTYPGTGPASEPEEQALETLFGQLFRDQRGPADMDAAPITATGAMVTLHSYSNLVLLPWGDSGGNAPNDAGLRALAYRMSYYNWFKTGRPAEVLYGVTGASDDFVYGTLGVAAFTWEIGFSSGGISYPTCAGFTPAYACQDARFWPEARPGLLYLAKAARQPYALALGPTVLSVSVGPTSTRPGAPVQVQARLADDALGGEPNSVTRPAAQAIGAAEAYWDTPAWQGGTPITLTARDGAFDQVKETVIGSLTAPTATGRHTLYVRGRDADGDWGPVTAAWLFVDDQLATPTPTPTGATPTSTPTPVPAACMLAPLAGTVAVTDSLGVMNCGSISVLSDTPIATLSLRLAANHTYAGDLRLQLRAPDGTALTLMSLPGMPGSGYSGRLSASYPITFADGAPYSAEQMGQAVSFVCGSDGRCRYSPAPDGDPYSDVGAFSAFVGGSAMGTWQICLADHYPADIGSITSAALLINCDGGAPTATPTATATAVPVQLIYYFPRVAR